MQATETTTNVAVHPDGIPDELKQRNQWVTWRFEERENQDGETYLTKVPYDPNTKKRASVTDLTTWSAFEAVLEAYEGSLGYGEWDGIGFVLSSGDPYTGIDLDNCRDPETGQIDAWAQGWLARFDGAHAELSPSGTGLHIIALGKTPHNGKRTVDGKTVEVYSTERFFTFTGVAS